jgi:hypothetical protein
VADPFVGSGTTLVESMKVGLKFSGIDINPLAILICQAKSIPHNCDALSQFVAETLRRASSDRSRRLEAEFPSLRKWFTLDTAIRLSRLRRAIRKVPQCWARRFLWVVLAETVRLTSNARTTTFKLHIRSENEIAARTLDPLKVFSEVASRNVSRLNEQRQFLSQRQFLKRGRYIHDIDLTLNDVRFPGPRTSQIKRADLLITSPPYGDNVSTVTYGQHSFLPLQWIDLEDIDPRIDMSILRTTHEIDSRSLGGSRRVSAQEVTTLRTLSPAFARAFLRLRSQPRDRQQRIAAFYRDLAASLPRLISLVKPSAPMIWIVGNRHVGGYEVPMNHIFAELLEAHGCILCDTLKRHIPSKRMAFTNSVSDTVQDEHIILTLSPGTTLNRAVS